MPQNVLLFLDQYVLGSMAEWVSFGWLLCDEQPAFCEAVRSKQDENDRLEIVAVEVFRDCFHSFEGGESVAVDVEDEAPIQSVVDCITVFDGECRRENGSRECLEFSQWTKAKEIRQCSGVEFAVSSPFFFG